MAVEFRGSVARMALLSAGYLALTAGVGSFVLLGAGWPRFFLFSFLLCAIPICAICLLLLRIDRVVLDDESRVIRRPFRRPLPYDALEGFRVHNAGGMASLTTAKGGPILLYAFNPADEVRLESEMRQRWPDAALRKSRSSSTWLLFGLVALPVFLGEAYSWRLAARHDDLREPCAAASWNMGSSGPRDQQIGPFAVGVPADFTLQPGGTMTFGSDAADIVYSLEAASTDPFVQTVLRYGLGIGGSAQMIRWGACATSGILPLTAKATLFGADSTQRLAFGGGIAVLRQSEDGGNVLLAFSGPDEADLLVTVDFEQNIDTELLERIVSLVGIGPQRLARRTAIGPPGALRTSSEL